MNALDQELRELRQSAPPPERLDAVRARVLARIESRLRILPVFWLAGSAATAAFALLLWSPIVPEQKTLRFAWAPPEPPGFAWRIPHRRPATGQNLAATPASQPSEFRVVEWSKSSDKQLRATLLQLPSTDPNVVVYFIVDDKGD